MPEPTDLTMSPPLQPSLVIFDMDGLMIDSESLAVRNWLRVAQTLGFDVDTDVVISTAGTTRQRTQEILQAHLGDRFPLQEAAELYAQLSEETYRTEGVAIKPGLLQLLDYLDVRRIPTCVATSSSRANAEMKLGIVGLTDRFIFFVCGDEVEHSKPAPDIFLAACARGGVLPAEALVLEDSTNGLSAAVAAGIPCVVVPDLVPLTPAHRSQAAAVCDSLADVISLLGG